MKKILTLCLIAAAVVLSAVNLREQAKIHKQNAEKYLLENNYEGAVEEFRKVLSLAPEMDPEIKEKFIEAQIKLGISYIGKDNKKAADLFKDLMYNRKDETLPYYYLGYLSEQNGDYDGAEKYYKEFMEKDKLNIEKKEEAAKKISIWTKDRENYNEGIKYMADAEFLIAKECFKKVETINKRKAEEYIAQLASLLEKDNTPVIDAPKTDTPVKAPEGTGAVKEKVLPLFKKALESESYDALSALFSQEFICPIGNKTNYLSYFSDFWFLNFQNLIFDYFNEKQTSAGDHIIISFDYTLKGIYNGKDMTLYKPEFKFGNEYSIAGSIVFTIKKEGDLWMIIR